VEKKRKEVRPREKITVPWGGEGPKPVHSPCREKGKKDVNPGGGGGKKRRKKIFGGWGFSGGTGRKGGKKEGAWPSEGFPGGNHGFPIPKGESGGEGDYKKGICFLRKNVKGRDSFEKGRRF